MVSGVWQKDFPPITRATLALYAGASGDHNAAHIDSDAAKAAGFSDVFGQGMLGMAYMGQTISDTVPPERIRCFSARFVAITQLGARLSCTGRPVRKYEEEGEERIAINLEMTDQFGETKLTGHAVVAVGARS
ncbi:MaoC/PaaZ C-terminal domain-containing protein [Parasphingopyxis marina]|uniref:Dehydratase n=1 Tax=Parasphingopyxis marina TaxID=2761622 RepID=A0A842I134_9SPHN|nr:MaoC/PaaZ C-terminal domain-containing protein [Parasphingopyxis marina]MBC2778932.1 dehydratase [Parasphingopyxis marina]